MSGGRETPFDVLAVRGLLDARSAAADAPLDYRNPPPTPQSDRIAQLEERVRELEATHLARIAALGDHNAAIRAEERERIRRELLAEAGAEALKGIHVGHVVTHAAREQALRDFARRLEPKP